MSKSSDGKPTPCIAVFSFSTHLLSKLWYSDSMVNVTAMNNGKEDNLCAFVALLRTFEVQCVRRIT